MFRETTLVPAYGRDYKSAKAVLTDFNTGKDFALQPSGRYASKKDLPAGTYSIRYSNLRKVLVVTLPEKGASK